MTKISAGGVDSLFIKSDGSLWGMGDNTSSELGLGGFQETNLPVEILASNVTAIAAGGESDDMFLKSDGSLWVMGYDGYADMGFVETNVSNAVYPPTMIVPGGVTAISTGDYFSLFIGDGTLFGTGWDFYGQLGGSTTNDEIEGPQAITNGVTAIAGGGDHTLFIESGGSLWAMGYDGYGELGDGTYGNPDANNSVSVPELIVSNNVTAIAAGYYHSLFLMSDGSLWGMGDNQYGQIGPTNASFVNVPIMILPGGVTAISAGFYDSLFLKSDGSLWGMGYNNFGQLGNKIPVNGWTNTPVLIVSNNVTAIAAGYYHSLFLMSDGSLWAMGVNGSGQLGDGSYNNTNSPVLIVAGPLAVTSARQSGMNLIFNASGGPANTPIVLLTSPNLLLPPAQWTPVATNELSSYGYFTATVTNAIVATNASEYFMFKEP